MYTKEENSEEFSVSLNPGGDNQGNSGDDKGNDGDEDKTKN